MKTSLIVAVGEKGEIGAGNDLLWHLPDDLKYFKNLTMGHPMIMGRRTFESIGRALPGRISIVVSSGEEYRRDISSKERCMAASSLEEALLSCQSMRNDIIPHPHEPFITGGGQIYRQAMEKLIPQTIYLTRVHASFPHADTFFPMELLDSYTQAWEEHHPACDGNPLAYTYTRLEKK